MMPLPATCVLLLSYILFVSTQPFPNMAARVGAYMTSEVALLANPTLLGPSDVRDLAAAAWVLLNTQPTSPANVSTARAMLERVLASQRPSGIFPWTFDGKHMDNNAVQFVSLPVLLSVVHFSEALGADTVKGWLPRLELAARASFAEGLPGEEAQPFYTNIYTMRLVNLMMFAQVTGNATVRAQADRALATWASLVDGAGVHEYNSPTYTAVTLVNLHSGLAAITDPAVSSTLRRYVGFFEAMAAATFVGPAQGFGGPKSRDYDTLFGAAGMDWWAGLSGVAASGGVVDMDALCNDNDRITNAHLYTLWMRGELPQPPPATLALAVPPTARGAWKVARSTYAAAAAAASGPPLGATNGSDWTVFAGPTASLGTASRFYGAQDRMAVATLRGPGGGGVPVRLPQITLVADRWDSPYGAPKGGDCGRDSSKPTHMSSTVAAVQDGGLALVLNDLTPALAEGAGCGEYDSVAMNVIFPGGGAAVDGVYTGAQGVRVANASAGAPPIPLPLTDSFVAVRCGGGVVGFALPFVDGLKGYVPNVLLQFDGPHGMARLTVYLYQGRNTSFGPSPPPSRSIALLAVGEADSDAAVADFVASLAALRVENSAANESAWTVTVAPAAAPRGRGGANPLPRGFSSTLTAAVDVGEQNILARAVNGSALQLPAPGALELYGSDGSRESLSPGNFSA